MKVRDSFTDDCGGVRHVLGTADAAVRLERKKYAVRALRLPAGGGGVRRTVVRLRRAAAACGGPRGGILPCAGLGHGRHPSDGYADTCDALSSYGDTAKKLEILKDPHCGAFAVIRLCSYFAAYFALCGCVAFTPRVGVLWTLALVGERALSGLAVAAFPLAKNTGLAHTFATAADRVRVRQVLAVLCAMLAVGLTALGGWALVLAAGCTFARYYVVAKNSLAV